MESQDALIVDNMKAVVESSMSKRNREREEDIAREKVNREESGKENIEERVSIFYQDFNPLVKGLEDDIEKSSCLSKSDLTVHLTKVAKSIQDLQRFVADSTFFLPSYDKRKAQGVVNDLSDKFQTKQDEVMPKKKFGFKGRKQKIVDKPEEAPADETDEVAGMGNVKLFNTENFHSVKDKTGERVELGKSSVDDKDVSLSNLTDCIVIVRGRPTTLHITKIKNSTILCGPVTTSILIEGCDNSTLALSCQQLRIHLTNNTHFYLHVTAKAVIEDSEKVMFSPNTWAYPGKEIDMKEAGLDSLINNWDKVADFNWLAADKHSPNWAVLPEAARRTDLDRI